MSEHLKQARRELDAVLNFETMSPADCRLWRAMGDMLKHLEAQEQGQPVTDDRMRQIFYEESMRRHMSPSETPSSAATATEQATPPTWSTSSTWSSHASLRGGLPQSLREDISAWLSLLRIPGHVQEVEIGVVLGNKGIIQQCGLLSRSTKEATRSPNGVAGEHCACCLHSSSQEAST